GSEMFRRRCPRGTRRKYETRFGPVGCKRFAIVERAFIGSGAERSRIPRSRFSLFTDLEVGLDPGESVSGNLSGSENGEAMAEMVENSSMQEAQVFACASSTGAVADPAFWFAVQTRSRHEKVVAAQLLQKGIET